MLNILSIPDAVVKLQQGEVIAYPTEAVYGLGCDPQNATALNYLLALKNRDANKGLILIASDIKQVDFYIDYSTLSKDVKDNLLNNKELFVTWLLPINFKNKEVINKQIYGQYDTIAVRISNHVVVKQLCTLFGKPIISTSANISGETEIKQQQQLHDLFENKIAGIVEGELGKYTKPSTIIDARTGKIIRY